MRRTLVVSLVCLFVVGCGRQTQPDNDTFHKTMSALYAIGCQELNQNINGDNYLIYAYTSKENITIGDSVYTDLPDSSVAIFVLVDVVKGE